MTAVQRVAQIFGGVFILVGIAGFYWSRGSMEADPAMAPQLIGLFPVNVLHNLVHIALGVWGLLAARSFDGARAYARIAGIAYIALAVLGMFVPDTFGLIPIGGNVIWLHAILGIALAAAGFMAKPTVAPAAV
ncbi:MAG TPA: DUF4383 domain-containing protein [Longimicrobiales bacterium]|nr:DUF4383 domain-containing protein [Longimicrobiales bacterium]